ncbi:MAG: hypothetical protein IPK26_28215 [Planctomycetes bacterium]|nr:hypothetical protein [Planctomycetota bacterium]
MKSIPAFASLLFACLSPAVACAQQPPPPAQTPVAEEQDFLATGAKELNAYATLAFKNGYPRRAREVWLEVIAEYAPDDPVAREQLGYVRQGSVWQKKSGFEYPTQDVLNATVAKMLEQRWDSVAKKLGDGHRTLAGQLETAGKKERAQYHFQRALRFAPGDAKAIAGAGVKQAEGISGSDAELTLLKRSRMMDRSITRLLGAKYKVDVLGADQKQAVLDKAKVTYSGVKSENFTVWGDWETDVLKEAAANAERALAFGKDAYDGFEGFPPANAIVKQMAFFKSRDTFRTIVAANKDTIGEGATAFILENANATQIGGVHVTGAEQVENVNDLAVRWVAQEYSGVRSDALREGIGHTVVGMFFGRNLTFTVGQQEQKGTATRREQQKLQLPDIDTWRELAVELAFQKDGTKAARLPLLKAASFPNDARIKSWSFCDYLLRRDPMLLKALDRTAAKSRNDGDVEAEFATITKLTLAEVEDGWRRFWTEDTPLRRAIVNKASPMEAASKEAPNWLDEFNRARKALGGEEVGWSSSFSTDCKMHVDYLKANKDQRGPVAEHTQVAGKTGFTNAGKTFAETALVWTRDKDQKKAMATWLSLPGFRDGLLNRQIDTVGIYADAGIVCIDVQRGRMPSDRATVLPFPLGTEGNRYKGSVPSALDVELLGPDAVAVLERAGKGKQKQIGFPLTLHGFGANTGEVQVDVSAGNESIKGELLRPGGKSRRTSAPGMWVFWPHDPLPKGKDITVRWTYQGGNYTVVFNAS